MPTRYRYFKIESPLVAKALEALSLLTDTNGRRPPRHHKIDKDICFARTCYDHLAGELGVKITTILLQADYLQLKDNEFFLTTKGQDFFRQMNVTCNDLIKLKRQFTKPCLDWTERQYHLAGSLGSVMLNYFIDHRMLIHSKHKARVVVLTEKGRQWIKKHLAIT